MSLRAVHLACVLLLLSSVGAAEASASREHLGLRVGYIAVLLQQGVDGHRQAIALGRSVDTASAAPLHAGSPIRAPWTLRPPAAHSLQVHAVTGSGL